MEIKQGFKIMTEINQSIKEAQNHLNKLMPMMIERDCPENKENSCMALAHLKNAHTLSVMLFEAINE